MIENKIKGILYEFILEYAHIVIANDVEISVNNTLFNEKGLWFLDEFGCWHTFDECDDEKVAEMVYDVIQIERNIFKNIKNYYK